MPLLLDVSHDDFSKKLFPAFTQIFLKKTLSECERDEKCETYGLSVIVIKKLSLRDQSRCRH
jgi:hypothetical protein